MAVSTLSPFGAAPTEICHGSQHPSAGVEDLVGFRDYLFCVGFHISRCSCWRTRSAAVPVGCDAVPGRGPRFVCLDDRAGRAFTQWAALDVGVLTCGPDLRPRLWAVVLGRAACAFGTRSGDDGDDPGIYGAVGNRLSANAAAHRSLGLSSLDWDWRGGRADEPLVVPRR